MQQISAYKSLKSKEIETVPAEESKYLEMSRRNIITQESSQMNTN